MTKQPIMLKTSQKPGPRWRRIWLTLHELEHARINGKIALARLELAGLPRAEAQRRVDQTIREGFYLMSR